MQDTAAERGLSAPQTIYYPGFTIAGGSEPLAIIAVFLLLLQLAAVSTSWWLTLCALSALVVLHAVFWLRNQPVNRIWLKHVRLNRAGAAFFAEGPGPGGDWMLLRNRWEQAHAIRAGLGVLSLVLLILAVM